MKLCVVGTGYVGCVSGVCLAARGHEVTCVDINRAIVDSLNAGNPHIYERDMEPLLRGAIKSRHFRASDDLAAAIDEAEIIIIAVGTPSKDGAIDLTYIRACARSIGEILARTEKFKAIVVKSTVLPGTTDTVVKHELEKASGKKLGEFGLGMNPEFLREGNAIGDFMEPDRIVLGYEDDKTLALMEELYASWACDKIRVNTRTAELIKYANNTLLATQISAINEIANLAAAVSGIEIMDVVEGVHLDKRWSPITPQGRISPAILTYLVPGCGFGGSCFPKDVQALRSQGEQLGLKMDVLNAVLDVNEIQPRQVTAILEKGAALGKTCLLLGLAFKPDTDDVRESASIKILESLIEHGVKVLAHDPLAMTAFKKAVGSLASKVDFVEDWAAATREADTIIVATRWDEYRKLATLDLAGKAVFDARRMFSADELPGARYFAIGRRLGA